MSDDRLPDRAEQASAYLDGQLEADERAVVEGDPDALALVDSFARIRAELSDVLPADDAARAAAIAAALGEFDARHDAGPPAAAAAAVVTPLPSRRDRGYRVLMGVAAAVVIAVVGIAAINSSKGNDNNSSAAVAPEQTVEPPQLKIAADTAAADAGNAAGAAPAGTAAPGAASIESAVTALPEINSKQELAAFARSFESATAPAPAGSTTVAAASATTAAAATGVNDSSFQSPCLTTGVTELGQVVYSGKPAVVVVDNATGTVKALDAADCSVLETVP